jgi:hypothetical protein
VETEANLRRAFQDSLNGAILHGLRPSRSTGLGAETYAAIDAVAQEHPDATVCHIADAYDAFALEHSAPDPTPMVDVPTRLVARRPSFKPG